MSTHGETHIQEVTWNTSVLTSEAVSVSEALYAEAHVPSTFVDNGITFQGSTALTGTYYAIQTASAAASQRMLASKTYPLPNDVVRQHSIKLIRTTVTSVVQSIHLVCKTGA